MLHLPGEGVAGNTLTEPTLFSAAWRYKWVVLVTTLAAVALGLVWAVLHPPTTKYTARASLVIQATGSGLDLGTSGSPQRFVANQVEILRSEAVADLASQKAAEQDPPLELSPDDITSGLFIASSSLADLIDVVFTYPDDPDVAIGAANAVVDAYRQLVASEKSAQSDAALQRIDAEMATLDAQASSLEQQIADLNAQNTTLVALRAQYDDALNEIVGLQAEAVDADATRLTEIRARLSDLRSLINTYQAILSVGVDSPELGDLSTQHDQVVARRDALIERRDTIAVDVELSPDVVAFSSPASSATPQSDSGPGRTMALALIAGLGVGMGLAFLLAMRRRVFHDRMEPEVVLGVQLLTDIPNFAEEGLKTMLPVRDEPRSASAEAFRFAAASLELKMNRQEARSIVIVSPTIGAGKSTVAANISVAAARQGNKVLVVDADFGNQALTSLLAGDEGTVAPGLTEVVSGGLSLRQAIRDIEVGPDLLISLLSRGRQPVPAADLLRSEGARELFATAKEEYDMVLVDAPPLLQVAYASTIASLVDSALVLVAHGGSVAQLDEANSRLGLIGVPVLGYIYNASPLRREMTVSEGSTADVLGDANLLSPAKKSPRGWKWPR